MCKWNIRAACRTAFSALVALGIGTPAHAEPELRGGPLMECSGLPCVEVSVDSGKSVKMMVDTGNLRSLLDVGAAKRLGLKLEPFVGRDGKVHAEFSSATLKDVKLGTAALGDITVMVVNLAPSVLKGALPEADGLLSYAAFAQRLLRLDFRQHRVDVSDVLTQTLPCPAECGALTTPTFGKQGPPIVATTGFTVNDKPVRVQVDTMYAGTMLVYPTSVDKLGLAAEQGSAAIRKFPFTDGGVEMIESRAASEGFGRMTLARNAPLYFATPDVHTPDGMFDGTVGQQLLTGHVITFDFFAHHFWMS
jgi:hypothetical protein